VVSEVELLTVPEPVEGIAIPRIGQGKHSKDFYLKDDKIMNLDNSKYI
jgi:hypothetical protein